MFVVSRKVILVIVEGPSDDTALGSILGKIFEEHRVFVKVTFGDITTDRYTTANNVAGKLGDLVKAYAQSMYFERKDFLKVIHIVDMDGAYIPDDAIVENSELNKSLYSLTEIQTAKPENIARRNEKKRNILNRISTLKKVWGSIPYQVYYMSCNLDHVLYNKMNISDEEKEENAYKFAEKYKNDIPGFLCFISESDFSRVDDYKESWIFIKDDVHSLERFTNLGLCFADIDKEKYLLGNDDNMK